MVRKERREAQGGAGGRPTSSVRRVVGDRRLRRLTAAHLTFAVTEHASWLGTVLYAFQRGGAREAGVVATLALLPGVLLSPFAAYVGDRFRPHRALAGTYTVQAACLVLSAVGIFTDLWPLAYAGLTAAATAVTFSRPVTGALVPRLTRTPHDLVATTTTLGVVEQSGLLIGPLLAGAITALTEPGVVFSLAAAATAGAAVLALGLHPDDERAPGRPSGAAVTAALVAGFRVVRAYPRVRLLLTIGAVAAVGEGVAGLVVVTYAEDRLSGGGASSGLLAAGVGAGSLVGALLVGRVIGSGRVSRAFVGGGLGIAVSCVLLAATAVPVLALVAFMAIGVGFTVVQGTASSSLHREAPPAVIGRVFGIAEALAMASMASGSVVVTGLDGAVGLGGSLAVVGLTIGVVLLAGVAVLRRLGGARPLPDEALVGRLLDDPVLAPLPPSVLDRLACAVERHQAAPGEVVVRQGDRGDRYYLVRSGALDVTIDTVPIRTLGPGSAFGEIALLRNVPRTATVTASAPSELLSIGRDLFLDAVTGHARSSSLAEAVTEQFLLGDRRPAVD